MTLSADALQNVVSNTSPQQIRVLLPKPNEGTGRQLQLPASYSLNSSFQT
jgi:hypothetical protein